MQQETKEKVQLSEKEEKLIRLIREMGFGELRLFVGVLSQIEVPIKRRRSERQDQHQREEDSEGKKSNFYKSC